MGKMADLYKPDWDTKARKLAELGLTDDKIADFFGINTNTLGELKVEYPTFRESLQRGKDVIDAMVEASYLLQTLDRYVDVEELLVVGGKVERHMTKQFIRGDARACASWLSCRRPQEWRRKSVELDFKQPGDSAARFSGYERARRLAFLLTQQPGNGDASKPH